MRRIRRHRKIAKVKALKPPGPLYTLDREQVTEALVGGRW